MTAGIGRGVKVNVKIGGALIPGIILFQSFASTGTCDLYMVRIARYSQVMQTWLVSDYGPVQSSKLTRRQTYIPELDLDEQQSHHRSISESAVQQIQT